MHRLTLALAFGVLLVACDPWKDVPPPVAPAFDPSAPPRELHTLTILVERVDEREDFFDFDAVVAALGLSMRITKDRNAEHDATLVFHTTRSAPDYGLVATCTPRRHESECPPPPIRVLATASLQADEHFIGEFTYEIQTQRPDFPAEDPDHSSGERLASAILHSPQLLAFARRTISERHPPPADPSADENGWRNSRVDECFSQRTDAACSDVRAYLSDFPGGAHAKVARNVLKRAGLTP